MGAILILVVLFFAWALLSRPLVSGNRRERTEEEALTIEDIRYLRSQCWNKPVSERRRMVRNYKRRF